VTGHSLGGALGILFSFILHAQEQTDILNSMDSVMAYGQPRAGDGEFANYMETFTGLQHQRMVYRFDIFPGFPSFSTFRHFGNRTCYTSWYQGQVCSSTKSNHVNSNKFVKLYILVYVH